MPVGSASPKDERGERRYRAEVLRCPAVRIECPTCKRVLEDAPADFAPRPFCSPRCKLADLHNWLSENYRISNPLAVSEYGDADGERSGAAAGGLPPSKQR